MRESRTIDGQVYTILPKHESDEQEITTITVLFLGDAGVGKSSFLSYVSFENHSIPNQSHCH